VIDVRRLVLLRDLAEYQTVTAVADVHHVTASAVSQQLRALEHEVGRPLLLREGRTVRLTAAGNALARRCEDVLAALERASADLKDLDGTIAGELAVGCFTTGFATLAVPMARRLSLAYPRLCPRLTEGDPERTLPMLKQRRLDMVIAYRYHHLGTALPAGLISRQVHRDPFLIAVPDRLRDLVECDGVAALHDQPWITQAGGTCFEATMIACRAAGFTPTTAHECGSLPVTMDLVAAGLGVAMMPGLAGHTVPAGVSLLPAKGLHRTIEAVVRAGTENQPVIAAALTALKDCA